MRCLFRVDSSRMKTDGLRKQLCLVLREAVFVLVEILNVSLQMQYTVRAPKGILGM